MATTAETPERVRRPRLPAAERRAGLLKAARTVFQENGLAGARTKQIARLAGTSEAILYRHFASKDELFEAAILEPVEALVADLIAGSFTMAGLSGRDSRRKASYDVNAEVFERMREVTPLLGTALFSDREAGSRFYRQCLEPLMDELNLAIAASLDGWKHKPVTPEILTSIHLGTYFWVALQEYFGRPRLDSAFVSGELTDILSRAL